MNAVAKDILTPHVVSVTEDMELRTVAQLFEDEAITGAPVVDEQGHVVGVISRSDLVAHDLTTPRSVPPEVLAAATVKEDTPIPEVAARMAQQGIHRVIVVDKAQQLRGIVTSMDVLWWVAAQG